MHSKHHDKDDSSCGRCVRELLATRFRVAGLDSRDDAIGVEDEERDLVHAYEAEP